MLVLRAGRRNRGCSPRRYAWYRLSLRGVGEAIEIAVSVGGTGTGWYREGGGATEIAIPVDMLFLKGDRAIDIAVTVDRAGIGWF